MAKISRVEPKIPALPEKKKVAAYARVSKDSEKLLHSVSAQISYYNDLIQKNPDWEFAGVYADQGITGTRSDLRPDFVRLIEDCEKGRVDIILTKSVSRFARNTVDLLNTVRHLRDLGVSVRFEKENIDSMSGDGELMLTILASMAQAESESTSQNIKWAKRKQAEQGIMTNTVAPYGYRCEDRQLIVIPEQAEVVRRIFDDYTEKDLPIRMIAKNLNAEHIPGQKGNHWQACTVYRMLSNVVYIGDLVLLKYFIADPLEHRMVKNRGEQPMYYVEDDHEPIVSRGVFEKAGERLRRDAELGVYANRNITRNEFSQKIICKGCGCKFSRQSTKLKTGRTFAWSCKKPGGKCMTPSLLENELQDIFCKLTGMEEYTPEAFSEMVDSVEVGLDDVITFNFANGTTKDYQFIRRKASPLKTRREDISVLSGKIICGRCGRPFIYRSQIWKGKERDYKQAYWNCPDCKGFNLRDDDIRNLIAEVLGTAEFDDVTFTEKVNRISVDADKSLTFEFSNGRKKTVEWHQKNHRAGFTWSPERRQTTSEKMKKLRKERGDNWVKS